jgi:aryl-phospho-beta-D-glucosidase BglC (GH1 family)
MKKNVKFMTKFLGLCTIIAFVLAIGFLFAACDDNVNCDRIPFPTLGWNLGNTLDAIDWTNPANSSETTWGNQRVCQELINGVKAQGFNLIRIPITWTGFTGPAPNYTIDPAKLNRVTEVVGYAKNAGLNVIINVHHDGVNNGVREQGWLRIGDAATDQAARGVMNVRLTKLWEQIANHFKGNEYGEWLMFASVNEVHDGSWGGSAAPRAQMDVLHEWNQLFTDVVRSAGGSNARRFLIYPSIAAKPERLFGDFTLPTDPAGSGRQIVTFHYYDPFSFAHDGTSYNWGTQRQKDTVNDLFKRFNEEFISKGIPVIIGEMGPRMRHANNMAENNRPAFFESRLAYIEYVYGKAHEYGLIPVYWDDGGAFRMMGRGGNRGPLGQPADENSAASFAAMRRAVGIE